MRAWKLFVSFGRVDSSCMPREEMRRGQNRAYWCHLSEAAWAQAHQERRARADRLWEKRTWLSTEEARTR